MISKDTNSPQRQTSKESHRINFSRHSNVYHSGPLTPPREHRPKLPRNSDRVLTERCSVGGELLGRESLLLTSPGADTSPIRQQRRSLQSESYATALNRSLFSEESPTRVRLSTVASLPLTKTSCSEHPSSFHLIQNRPAYSMDAPGIYHDDSLTLLDWCNTHGLLTIALSHLLYVQLMTTGCSVSVAKNKDHIIITAVAWSPRGTFLAYINEHGNLYVHCGITIAKALGSRDKKLLKKSRTPLFIETSTRGIRIGALTWAPRHGILAAGGHDGLLRLFSSRPWRAISVINISPNYAIQSLAWAPNAQFLASGSADGGVSVFCFDSLSHHCEPMWSVNGTKIGNALTMAFSPGNENSVLMVAGGKGDDALRFWDSVQGLLLQSMPSKEFIKRAIWNPNSTEFALAHGEPHNELAIWRYPSLLPLACLRSHRKEITQLIVVEDSHMVITASPDGTIRMWRCFATDKPLEKEELKAFSEDVLR